jgi:hypothetical protein
MNTSRLIQPGTAEWFAQQEEIAEREARIARNQQIFAERVRIRELEEQKQRAAQEEANRITRELNDIARKRRQQQRVSPQHSQEGSSYQDVSAAAASNQAQA